MAYFIRPIRWFKTVLGLYVALRYLRGVWALRAETICRGHQRDGVPVDRAQAIQRGQLHCTGRQAGPAVLVDLEHVTVVLRARQDLHRSSNSQHGCTNGYIIAIGNWTLQCVGPADRL